MSDAHRLQSGDERSNSGRNVVKEQRARKRNTSHSSLARLDCPLASSLRPRPVCCLRPIQSLDDASGCLFGLLVTQELA